MLCYQISAAISCFFSVVTGASSEEPAEEPAERLQPDGAARGQRLSPPYGRLFPQFDTDHGRGRHKTTISILIKTQKS